MADKEKLELWKGRLGRAESDFAEQSERFDDRERMYKGRRDTRKLTRDDRDGETVHVRNLAMELIESQVDSSIPQPKVTARREADQPLAKIIEDMIRNELDRLPMEEINDMMARTVPIQGGAAFLLEWDNTLRTHNTVGELWVSAIHPKQIVPQPGIYTGIEDMDWIILKIPQTKEYILRKYGVDVDEEGESEPDVKGVDDNTAEDLVTEYAAYYRNDEGGIGKYCWCNNVELEDLDDYQARRIDTCGDCGSTEIVWEDGKKTCRDCGSHKIRSETEDMEEIWQPIERGFDKPPIPGAVTVAAPMGSALLPQLDAGMFPQMNPTGSTRPTIIPYYKPDLYPVILQKNVSVYGQLLGASDLDAIEDQQNTTNRIEQEIIDKLVQSGSYLILPEDPAVKVDTEQGKVLRVPDPSKAAMISVKDLEGNIQQDMVYLGQIYEEARQVIGITDSFQGRKDTTATTGKAKQFAAAQTAGRLESKRTMRDAAWAALFEAMFKFRLAYTDEPVPIRREDPDGTIRYDMFNRYDFLEQDETGEWYWNDAFLFSVDPSTPLAQNRDAMWQETRLNLQSGAFGNPQDLSTLILFWRKMEILHYPDAGQTRVYLEQQLARQQEMQRQMMAEEQMMAQQAQAQAREDAAQTAFQQRQSNQAALDSIERQARQNAARDAMNQARQNMGRQSGSTGSGA
jgi:hypothetical protein